MIKDSNNTEIDLLFRIDESWHYEEPQIYWSSIIVYNYARHLFGSNLNNFLMKQTSEYTFEGQRLTRALVEALGE